MCERLDTLLLLMVMCQLTYCICVFYVALAEFQDHGLQSVDGHPQYGPGQSRAGAWCGQLGGQWGVGGSSDPRSAPATSPEKSVLHSHGVHSGGGSREGSFGFRRPVSLIAQPNTSRTESALVCSVICDS